MAKYEIKKDKYVFLQASQKILINKKADIKT